MINNFPYLEFYGCAARHIRTTERRLGEAAASTTVHAGHKRSSLHYTFCGVTAAVAPNRLCLLHNSAKIHGKILFCLK